MAKRSGPIQALTAVALAAPLLWLVAVSGTRLGLWDWTIGYSLLTRQVALWLAVAGVGAALLALLLAMKNPRRLGIMAAAGLIGAGATLGLLIRHGAEMARPSPGWDVTTNPADPPGLPTALTVVRDAEGAAPAVNSVACPGLEPLSSQSAPEAAGYALQQAGFRVRGFGVGRADGVREGFWFGFGHDAVVRIRPGRTDVRVIAREARPDGGEACRLARAVREALEPS